MSQVSIQLAVRWYPPSYDIRVEKVPVPTIQHPDDAIVKVKLAALCGSDLHVYRGHEPVDRVHTCGHEFIGEVVELGSSFGLHDNDGRPSLYSSLKVGDKVVSPFTTNCGECQSCRLGYTCRCPEGVLIGSSALDGAQAQFIRVPKAGGTLYNLSNPSSWPNAETARVKEISDSSLLILGDILPTGLFAALQAVHHPKLGPAFGGRPWPLTVMTPNPDREQILIAPEDKILTFAIVGLGPVGVCTAVGLLDILATKGVDFRIVAVDPLQSRREKMMAVYEKIGDDGKGNGKFIALDIDEAKEKVKIWTAGIGCNAVLEIVGNNSALSLAYDLVRPFGVISSVGVHKAAPMPFTGDDAYSKNISLDFGRCPARAMIPAAFDLLVKRQDVFGPVGEASSLIDRVVDLGQAVRMYRAFDEGEVGKIVFDPWRTNAL